ncbi:hypothetical protein HYH02_000879 [Chlamydomonas schloesseri]|uniref:F5/8 type C domain-containing protein n=1 Tax=Chlamydomonas schloesseri TaxID=2026947 RepID=A0A835WVG1_9CHLO|nr:hypothetical protein HYH02_000879 [Chlamydomonas schloesseri]|eukprot:KAG2455054.1 hypothetical protein HYH02_000879 [Chlamydomonas schloesseri]
MLRVNNGVLVVPPFEAAWLTGDGFTLRNGTGCVSFEAKGETDVTVILKSTPGAKRLQPLLRQTATSAAGPGHSGGNALQVEENYTIIFGSHRNSCLKIEKNGVTQCMVGGVPCSRVSGKVFSKFWIDLNHGVLTVGHGEPGQGVCHQWRDAQEIPGIQHIGLSCWDRHVSYRSIALQPSLDFSRLQREAAAQLSASACPVPSLFDATCAAIMAAATPANICSALAVAELLLPTTQKLYRFCLDFIARHFETVVALQGGGQLDPCCDPAALAAAQQLEQAVQAAAAAAAAGAGGAAGGVAGPGAAGAGAFGAGVADEGGLLSVSPAAMCDLVCQNTFSVDEQGIYWAVRDWACHHVAQAAASAPGPDVPMAVASAAAPAGAGAGPQGRKHSDDLLGNSPRAALAFTGGPQQRVAGDSPRRLSAPELDVSSLVSALHAAAAAAEEQQQSDTSTTGVEAAGADAAHQASHHQQRSEAAGSAVPATHHALMQAQEDAARVLSLIRYPLLPIEQLHGCLADPLLARLPAVLALVHEALEVHRRETGAVLAPPQHQAPLAPQQLLLLGEAAAAAAAAGATAAAAGAGAPGAAGAVGAGVAAGMVPCGGAVPDGAGYAAAGGCGGVGVASTDVSGCVPLPGVPLAPAGSLGCAGVPGGANSGTGAFSRSTSMPAPASERRLVKPLAQAGASGSGAADGAHPGTPGPAGTPHALQSPAKPSAVGGAAGASGGADGAAAAWSVRYQRRCLPFALELEYVCDGDSSGVLHFLGTQYGAQGWVNPMLAKRVDVRASSPTGRTTDPRVLAGRQFVRTNFAGPRYVNGVASSWWQVDLGEQHQLAITYYTLRHDGSQDFARSWVLQGSHDLSNWVDLKRHANDTTIKVPGQYASWPVIGPAAATPYRAFRLLLTAPNASPNPASRYNFCLSNVELYGFMYKGSGAGGGWAASAAAAAASAAVAALGQPAGAGGGTAATAGAVAGAQPNGGVGSTASCSTSADSSSSGGGAGGGSSSSSNSTPVGSAANSTGTGAALSAELHDGAVDEPTRT